MHFISLFFHTTILLQHVFFLVGLAHPTFSSSEKEPTCPPPRLILTARVFHGAGSELDTMFLPGYDRFFPSTDLWPNAHLVFIWDADALGDPDLRDAEAAAGLHRKWDTVLRSHGKRPWLDVFEQRPTSSASAESGETISPSEGELLGGLDYSRPNNGVICENQRTFFDIGDMSWYARGDGFHLQFHSNFWQDVTLERQVWDRIKEAEADLFNMQGGHQYAEKQFSLRDGQTFLAFLDSDARFVTPIHFLDFFHLNQQSQSTQKNGCVFRPINYGTFPNQTPWERSTRLIVEPDFLTDGTGGNETLSDVGGFNGDHHCWPAIVDFEDLGFARARFVQQFLEQLRRGLWGPSHRGYRGRFSVNDELEAMATLDEEMDATQLYLTPWFAEFTERRTPEIWRGIF